MIEQFFEYLKTIKSLEEIKKILLFDNKGNLIITKELTELLKVFLKDRNNEIVLTENDMHILIGLDLPNSPYYEEEQFQSTDELVASHVTPVIPTSDKILTRENGGVTSTMAFRDPTTGIEHYIEYPSGNDTIHFTLNCVVQNHQVGNDWNSYKYGVLIDFPKLKKDKVLDVKSEDTYLDGDAELGEEYFLFCPKGEREEAQKNNPNATVIEYDGISLNDAMSSMIIYTGKKIEPYGTYGWGRSVEYGRDHEDVVKLETLTVKEGYPCLKGHFGNVLHSETKYMARRMWKKEYEAIIALLEYNEKNGVDMPEETIPGVLLYGGAYATPGLLEISVDNYKEYVIPILKKHNYEVDDSLFDGLEETTGIKEITHYPDLPHPYVVGPKWETILRNRVIALIKKQLAKTNDIGGSQK